MYTKDPVASSRRAPQKHRNTKIEPELAKIGGRNSAGATAGVISTFSNVFTIITMMKWVYSTFGLWVCAVA
jgi:hypothetical protein